MDCFFIYFIKKNCLDVSSVLLTIRILNEVFKEAFATSNTAEFQAFTNALEKQVRNLLRLIDTI